MHVCVFVCACTRARVCETKRVYRDRCIHVYVGQHGCVRVCVALVRSYVDACEPLYVHMSEYACVYARVCSYRSVYMAYMVTRRFVHIFVCTCQ